MFIIKFYYKTLKISISIAFLVIFKRINGDEYEMFGKYAGSFFILTIFLFVTSSLDRFSKVSIT